MKGRSDRWGGCGGAILSAKKTTTEAKRKPWPKYL